MALDPDTFAALIDAAGGMRPDAELKHLTVFRLLPAAERGPYAAGTWGPQAADDLIRADGREWTAADTLKNVLVMVTHPDGTREPLAIGGPGDRAVDEKRLADEPCTSTIFNRCHMREWLAFLATLRGKDPRAQLDAVNDYMNKAPYITDPVNWRVADYWSAPLGFLTKDGDCEDYAIAKYFSLRWLGWPVAALRIVVLQDLNLRVAHAILVAYLDGHALVLDNQIHEVVDASAIHHYRPIYSINEQHWWLHRM